MKNTKRIIAIMLIVISLLTLAGCGNKETPSTPAAVETTAAPTKAAETPADGQSTFPLTGQQYDLVYATNSSGTGNYTVAAAQGSIVTSKTGNVNVTVMATSGPEGIVAAIKAGSAQIGIQSSGGMRDAWGEGCDEALRAMFCGGATMFGFVTTEDTGIKTIADMVGKRVTYISKSATFVYAAEAILRGNGIDPEKDVEALTMTDSASALQDLVDGKTDVVISAISGAKMEELASKCTPYVIPVTNVEECAKQSNDFFAAIEVAKEFPGVQLGQPILATISQTSVTKETPTEAVYLFVKSCMENYEELKAVGSDLKDWTPENAVKKAAGYPFHEGAVIYFKESGMWSDEMEAWQQETLKNLGADK